MSSRALRLCLGAIAYAVALALAGCADTAPTGIRRCNRRGGWGWSGYIHEDFDMKDVAEKSVTGATLFLGMAKELKELHGQNTDTMDHEEFAKVVRSTIPFDYRGTLRSGDSIAIRLKSTFHRPPQYIGSTREHREGCFVGAVEYADGTVWTHGVQFGISGLRSPYFIPERP